MKITLIIDGKSCDFYATVTARKGREAYALKKQIVQELKESGGDYSDELMDRMAEFVVNAFDRQFTAQQFMDGYQGWFFDSLGIIDAVMNNVARALDEGFPAKNTAPQADK